MTARVRFASLPLLILLSILVVQDVSQAAGFHDYGDVLEKSLPFFQGQRSGKFPSHRLRWRRDSALRDGVADGVNLMGGHYDAGENAKISFLMAFTATLLAWRVVDFGKNMGDQLEEALRVVRWEIGTPSRSWGPQRSSGVIPHRRHSRPAQQEKPVKPGP